MCIRDSLRLLKGRPDLIDPVTVWVYRNGWQLASPVVERSVGARMAAQFLSPMTATVVAPVDRLLQISAHVNLPGFIK